MPSSYTLGTHFEIFVADLVKSGRYASASEVMRGGLRLLEDHEARRAALHQAIDEGLNSGPAEAWDVDQLKRSARARRAASAADG